MTMTRRMFGRQMLAAGMATALLARSLPGQVVPSTSFTAGDSLRWHADQRGLWIGSAVNIPLLDRDPVYAQTLMDQNNIVVVENAMKWAALRPGPERFDFSQADRLMDFAARQQMRVRGHNLCWHEALPAWFHKTATRQNAAALLTTHIQAVAGRYQGRIRAWDVVNEAIDVKDGQPGGLRKSPWYQLLGPGYLDLAFRAARAADPQALLTYNDYGIETDQPEQSAKRAAVLALVTRLKTSGVPIDAVGIQSHLSAGSASQIGPGLDTFIEACAALGLKVFVTELDVNDDALPGAPGDRAADGSRAQAVSAIYESYVRSLLRHAAVTDVLTWGTASSASWLNQSGAKFRPKHPGREELCLPFNDAYQPLPAFYGLRKALDVRPVRQSL